MNNTAIVNRILRSSIVDGPGNRATVFLQGCNFRCQYCHNPETINLCHHCGRCVALCPAGALRFGCDEAGVLKVTWDAALCTECDACIKICPRMSSPRTTEMTASEVMATLRPSLDFVRGVTVSGGECTLYPAFLRELGALVQAAGKTFFLDTNGSYDFSKDAALLAVTDGVMLDVKAPAGGLAGIMDEDFDWNEPAMRMARENAGGSGPRGTVIGAGAERDVWSNLEFLAMREKLWEIRTVVSPGLTTAAGTVAAVCRLLRRVKEGGASRLPRYKLIRYRPHGVRPQAAVRLRQPSDAELESLKSICTEYEIESLIV